MGKSILPALLLCLLVSTFAAITVHSDGIGIYKQGSYGNGTKIDYRISYGGCAEGGNQSRISFSFPNSSDVRAYLFYADYKYLLIDSCFAKNGSCDMRLVGKKELLNGLFILRAECPGCASTESDFFIDCLIRAHNEAQNSSAQNVTVPQNTSPAPALNFSPRPNFTYSGNTTVAEPALVPDSIRPEYAWGALIFAGLLVFLVLFHKWHST
jgi:hypothetical protein